VLERQPKPLPRVALPERLLVRAGVKLEHVWDVSRRELTVQALVLGPETGVTAPDVEGEEGRGRRWNACLSMGTTLWALTRRLARAEPRSSGASPAGLVGWK
jgi:hypothetical protein